MLQLKKAYGSTAVILVKVSTFNEGALQNAGENMGPKFTGSLAGDRLDEFLNRGSKGKRRSGTSSLGIVLLISTTAPDSSQFGYIDQRDGKKVYGPQNH